MRAYHWLRRAWQASRGCRAGHLWFPGNPPSEFLALRDTCLRCTATRVLLPYGTCLGGHPLADHYDQEANLVPVPGCPGPR